MKNLTACLSHLTLATLLLAFITSCAVPPPVPEDNYYQLPKATIKAQTKALAQDIAIKRLVSDGLHGERALLYSKADQALQLKQYHYHHWSDAPPRMLQEYLISALRQANVANTVTNYDPGQRTELTLSGKIRHFEQIGRGKKNEVLVEVELQLHDKAYKIVHLKDYRVSQIAQSAKPHDLVNAYGKALNTIVKNFINDWSK